MIINHIMCKSILTELCFTKQKIKKKTFVVVLQCFSSKNVLTKHKEVETFMVHNL